ncbi:MAG: RsmE family RNA methyltransferase [Rectinemataceae bacterium]|jgi:16S rRNA (uracil1498-N3)-methyltransferase
MRQFIFPEDWDGGATCLIEGGRAHYLARVLRLGPGSSFPGRDSRGRLWTCSVQESGPGRLLLAVAPLVGGAESEKRLGEFPRIVLVQGLLKGTKMDLVVRQATEAGVSAVFPLLSARTVAPCAPKGDEGSGPRLARWKRIIREALQQSGSERRTELIEPLSPADLPAAMAARGIIPSDPKILFHEAPLAQSSMHGYLTEAPEAVVLCVGPEGGFTPEEVDFFLHEGFKPLRLAGAVLRAETAALYAIATAQIILSERSSWIPKPL